MVIFCLVRFAQSAKLDWDLAISDSLSLFVCKVFTTHPPDSVVAYLWNPDVLLKLSHRIGRAQVSIISPDTQVVEYQFGFMGFRSDATYGRYREGSRRILVKQLSAHQNWESIPRPLYSEANYVADATDSGTVLTYTQRVIFDRHLKSWDIMVGRMYLSQTMNDLKKLLRRIPGR